MSLRIRIAMLVAATVLIASTIGGLGTALSSRSLGRTTVDAELQADAARIPADAPRLAVQLPIALQTRATTCTSDEATSLATEVGPDAGVDTGSRPDERIEDGTRPLNNRRLRFLPEFASSLQWVGPNGETRSACQVLPVSTDDTVIAQAGVGTSFRTVTIEGERFRILTQGFGDVGALQFARSLKLTEDTLRGLAARIIGFGVVGAVLAGLLGWIFAKRATDPVQRLNATAERVAQTRDLGQRIEVTGDAEIRALATSFNTMLASLDTSREQQQRLVQDASHELRTPLTSMRTNVELLQRHANIDGEVRAQVLADINAELAELTELTSELVESATEVPLTVQSSGPVDLVDVVTESVERARRRHRREIELRVNDKPDGVVIGDAALLGRAVTNLVNNAVKFSDGPIEVELTGGKVLVLDRGPGIADEDLDLIFERFYRSTTARSAPGSGLGLAIVKQIIEGHGGRVTASNRQHQGAVIGFSLPAPTPPDPVN